MSRWIGTWEGGRMSRAADGTVSYVIQGTRQRERYSISLGPVTLRQALAELALFDRDPVAYERERQARLRHDDEAGAVLITPAHVLGYTAAMRAEGATERYITENLRYLEEWAKGPLLGRDLRRVTVADLHRALDGWPKSKRKRVVALKSLTSYLRGRGELRSADDPTRDLMSMQSRKPDAKEREAKSASIAQLEAVYRHLDLQWHRDVWRVRCLTGLHVTEIDRIAHGECVVRDLPGAGEIAATVTLRHKSGVDHTQSIDAGTLAAVRRLTELGRLWDMRNEHVEAAAKLADVTPPKIAHLRHTFVTLAATRGRLVTPPDGGVPLTVIAQLVGHTTTTTTAAHYLGAYVPPMIALPLTLWHPDDPAPPKE